MSENAVHFHAPQPRRYVPAPIPGVRPRVAIHTVTLDDDPNLLTVVAEHVDGLNIAGMGAWHVPVALVERLSLVAQLIPVVLASGAAAGPVLRGTYGFAGSERDLIDRGLHPAGLLDPLKARVLLWCLLAGGAQRHQIADAFAVARNDASPDAWPFS
jgi:L-asparaginase